MYAGTHAPVNVYVHVVCPMVKIEGLPLHLVFLRQGLSLNPDLD